MKSVTTFLILLSFSVVTKARMNDVMLLKGRVHSFDPKQVRIEMAGQTAIIPRDQIVKDFKLAAQSGQQTVPVYLKGVSKIKFEKADVLKWPNGQPDVSAKKALALLHYEIDTSLRNKNITK